ncbi:patatin-like phospholipase family protein [Psychrobacter urativorans]|uniref:patatin-like phospholipase family protein n=1 Tax=Psychrobacter urativorans TaxID=45610 RepID=UPI001919434F|nr:patatin-like phospholipase family protein [Psychrobacter urativorans]
MPVLLTTKLSIRLSLVVTLTLFTGACSSLTPTVSATQSAIKAPSVALVLGGGGAKGFAHVGVIQALQENGITPTLIVGTSMGSLIGSLYASGMTADDLEQLAVTTPDSDLIDSTLSNQGFIQGIKLKNFINAKVAGQSIEDFPITFAAVAAEKDSLKKAVFTTGNAGLAVQASCSVPNIFIAPRIPETVGKKYIDGGVISIVPVDSAIELGADMVIAVDVTAPASSNNANKLSKLSSLTSLTSFWGLLENNVASTANAGAANSSRSKAGELQRADVVITPDVGHISSLDSSQRRALIEAGRTATTSQIKVIKQLIAEKSNSKYTTL